MTTNWAGNVTFGAAAVHRPSSVAELQNLVAGSVRARALGTGHSFNRLADTTGDLISVAGLPAVMDIDAARSTVTVAAGVRYGDLALHLDRHGYALHNLGSLPHISVAGACATGTHGSGVGNGNLATAVSAVDLVTATGELVHLDRTHEDFPAVVVGLGAFGIISTVTLDIQPTFAMRQYVYDGLAFDVALANFRDIVGAAYSVSLFTDWTGNGFNQIWVKQRLDSAAVDSGEGGSATLPDEWFGARVADGPRHPVPGMATEHCTPQLGEPGPWLARLPHFRLEFRPSAGEELQTEYLLPLEHAGPALTALAGIADRIAPVLHISEIRTVAGDELWLSPNYRRDSVALHFTWVADIDAVSVVIDLVESRLAAFGPRPHWGKLFRTSPEILSGQYERWWDFVALMGRYDPYGTFRNEMLDRYFPADR
jgi:xylitol oxidase